MREILQFMCNSISPLTVTCYGQTYEFLNYINDVSTDGL